MLQQNRSEAYDFSRFAPKHQEGETPEQQAGKSVKDNVIEMPKEQVEKGTKLRKRLRVLRVVTTCLGLAVMFGISGFFVLGQVQLTELTEQINTTNQKLEESQSVQTQLQMNLDSQTSLAKIESVATEDLGMKRVVQNQMNYIGLSEGDKGEVVTDTNSNWLASAWNAIVNLLS